MFNSVPDRYRSVIHGFSEAKSKGRSQDSALFENVNDTVLWKVIRIGLDRLEQRRTAGLDWSFFCTDQPIDFALAFSLANTPGTGAYTVGLTTMGLSRSEFLPVLEAVCPLHLADETVLQNTEDGINQAVRRNAVSGG
jgi:hypothetical protein